MLIAEKPMKPFKREGHDSQAAEKLTLPQIPEGARLLARRMS
jgi:hypothetical protein